MELDSLPTIGTDQLVTFWLGGEELAVPINIVQEIVKRPDICRVPNAPAFIEGIGNLRGNVLPIMNLRTKLGLSGKEPDEKTRVVVLNIGGVATGLVVDRVSEVLRIEPASLETPQTNLAGAHGQIVRAVAKVKGRKNLILILDEKQLLPELPVNAASESAAKIASIVEGAKKPADELCQVVTFKIAGEEFSLGIMEVKEIIRITRITPMPKAPASVVGVMALRNQLIPIIDLRVRFAIESLAAAVAISGKVEQLTAQRILIADLAGLVVGVLVDSVSQVLSLERSQTQDPPAILSAGTAKQVKGVSQLNQGKRLVMQMDLQSLLSQGELSRLGNSAEGSTMVADSSQGLDKRSEDEVQLVAFRIAGEEYALPIVKVQEIIKINQITAVPHTKAYIDGIINLRGNVVPVIDLRARFGLPRKTDLEQRRIVVVNVNGKTNGFIVDSVTEVLRIRRSQIESAPGSITSEAASSFVDGIGKLNDGKRIIVMVDPDKILIESDAAELALLKSASGTLAPSENPVLLLPRFAENRLTAQEPIPMAKVVSVLIADDSALMRREIKRILESDPGLRVVGVARNGLDAVRMTKELDPDVVTLDINMPVMDGLTALQHIMMECPKPVIMLSSLTQEGALTTYEALELGAVDYIGKPGGTVSLNIEQLAHEMIGKIKAVVGANLSTVSAARRRRRAVRVVENKTAVAATANPNSRVVVIGESTGGPNTIFDILPLLPANFPAPVIIVQHMPGTFTGSFANRLNQHSQMQVKHAESGDVLSPGHAYLAPGDIHLLVAKRGREPGFVLRTTAQPEDSLYRPSVNTTMDSALQYFGAGTVGVLLTGMGDDGADAMVRVREAGGRTIAEAEETCVVFGMPKEAIRRGGAEFVLPSYKIADKIIELLMGAHANGGRNGLRASNDG